MHTNDSSDKHDETFDKLVRQEELILEVTDRLTEALEAAGVTKAELAKRIGRSPGFVSHVFGGGRNLTLRTISDIAAALSLRPTLQLSADAESAPEGELGWVYEYVVQVPRDRPRIELPPIVQSVAGPAIQVA